MRVPPSTGPWLGERVSTRTSRCGVHHTWVEPGSGSGLGVGGGVGVGSGLGSVLGLGLGLGIGLELGRGLGLGLGLEHTVSLVYSWPLSDTLSRTGSRPSRAGEMHSSWLDSSAPSAPTALAATSTPPKLQRGVAVAPSK